MCNYNIQHFNRACRELEKCTPCAVVGGVLILKPATCLLLKLSGENYKRLFSFLNRVSLQKFLLLQSFKKAANILYKPPSATFRFHTTRIAIR